MTMHGKKGTYLFLLIVTLVFLASSALAVTKTTTTSQPKPSPTPVPVDITNRDAILAVLDSLQKNRDDADNELDAVLKGNPVWYISGEVTAPTKDETMFKVWGTARSEDAPLDDKGWMVEDGNIRIITSDKTKIAFFIHIGYLRDDGPYWFIRREWGYNVLGQEVPINVYGPPPVAVASRQKNADDKEAIYVGKGKELAAAIVEQAKKFEAGGDIDKAMDEYKIGLEVMDRFNAEIFENSGKVTYHFNKNNPSLAMDLYLIKTNILREQARFYEGLGEKEKAIDITSGIISDIEKFDEKSYLGNPVYNDYIKIGLWYLDKGRKKDAFGQFEKAAGVLFRASYKSNDEANNDADGKAYEQMKLDSQNPFAHYLLGLALYEAGYEHLAADEMEKAAQLDPKNPEYYNTEGWICGQWWFGKGNAKYLDVALKCYEKAIAIDPNCKRAYGNAVEAMKIQGNPNKDLIDQYNGLSEGEYGLIWTKRHQKDWLFSFSDFLKYLDSLDVK